jgi:hypothetical protein
MNDVNEHQRSTAARFGARADAYVTSAVHAHGDDLLALARLVAGAETARVLDLAAAADTSRLPSRRTSRTSWRTIFLRRCLLR